MNWPLDWAVTSNFSFDAEQIQLQVVGAIQFEMIGEPHTSSDKFVLQQRNTSK